MVKGTKNFADTLESSLKGFFSSHFFLQLSFFWFLFQSSVIAISTKFGLPPDENYHYNFIKLFTQNGWLPFLSSQEGFYSLGEAIRTPFFIYHYILSIPNHFLGQGDLAILILRFLNILLGFLSLLVLYRIARELNINKLTANLTIFIAANTLMFVFLSGSISYDNLFILASLLGAWLTIRILDAPKQSEILALLATLLIGLHIKKNFIVVAFLIFSILAFNFIKKRKVSITMKKDTRSKYLSVLLIFLIVILSVIFMHRYTYNLVSYASFEPKCTEVLSVEQCRENYVFSRNEMLDNMERPPATQKGYDYLFNWSLLMSERTYGVFAHMSFDPYLPIIFGIQSLLIAGFFLVAKNFRLKNEKVDVLLFLSAGYILILVFENYLRYERYGSFTFAVQGRYGLPFLLLIYLIIAYFASRLLAKKRWFFSVGVLSAIVFFASSLPSFILLTGSNWRNEQAINTKDRITKILNLD